MAALPEDEMYGIDPSTMEEGIPIEGQEQLPPELLEMMGQDGAVDPGSPPADPMLEFPGEPVEEEYDGLGEVEYREKVELCLLGAIEKAAKAVEVGIGAENHQFAQAYAQAAAALGQSYESLTRSEMAEKKSNGPQGPAS